ncbi:hypothetical protein C7H19_01585 [Aphanothece hegewaldii CCALA 016]|uniref:PEP-CTERM sorting domain-containing protein n=2 Tax=Aphanothece TaxID=1121 RepID=A0A2T1M3T6_9CHRO|nr:hypothetical protein C7H19_01585 [Aphanothece hegewaldii CCALA 016]
MRPLKLLSLLFVTTGVMLIPTVVRAATFNTLSGYTDTNFNNDKNNGLFQEDWVTEGRAASNNWDQAIWNWTNNTTFPSSTAAQASTPWPKNVSVPITITYNNGNASFSFNNQTISANNVTEAARFPNGLNTIYIRTRSNNDGSTIQLNNISITDSLGTFTTNLNALSNNSLNVDYLKIEGINGNFTLTANATFGWTTSSSPTDSRLAFQVKMGANPQAVPEPLTILGAATAIGFGTFFKKALRKNQ